MGTFIDYAVVTVIVLVGLVIMYRALKEPLDLLFGGIAKMFGYAKEQIVDSGDAGYEVIRYG